jgi:predicted dehydrogenase
MVDMVKPAFRAAIVGAGYMGALHARVLAEAGFAELALVVDPSPAAATLAGQHGAEHAPSLDGLVGRTDIDAVVVAAPDRLHAEIAIALLDDGKSVLLEKPIAHTGAAAQAVVEAAERSGGRLLVGHTVRFDPRYVDLAQAVADGELGQCVHVTAGRLTHAALGRRVGAMTNTALHLGIHDIDAIQWIAQDPIARVHAVRADGGLTGGAAPEDATFCTVELASAGVGHLFFGWSRPDDWPNPIDSRFEFNGTAGVGRVVSHDDGGMVYTTRPRYLEAVYGRVTNGVVTGAHYETLRHFFTALTTDAPFVVEPESAAAAVRVCDAIARSLETGQPETVSHGGNT